MFNFQWPWQHVVGTSLVFTGSAEPEQPPRKKCKRKLKDTSNANALSSLQLEGSSGIAPPCNLPALTFANAVEVPETAERFPTWVEDVFQQTSQLQCSHFPSLCILVLLPQAGVSSNSLFTLVYCYVSRILVTSINNYHPQLILLARSTEPWCESLAVGRILVESFLR